MEFLHQEPNKIQLDNVETDESTVVTYTNKSEKRLLYRFRLPPNGSLSISPPTGVIQPSEKVSIDVKYFEEQNKAREVMLNFQVKCVLLEEGEPVNIDNLENHQNKVDKGIITVTFEDREDEMFLSPPMNPNRGIRKGAGKSWWKNN